MSSYDDWLTTPPDDGPICEECDYKKRSKCAEHGLSSEDCQEYWDTVAREDRGDRDYHRERDEGF